MKKKYIRYSSGMLIGLLSLSTLSSCVNTATGLGMGPWSSKSSSDNGERGDDGGRSKKGIGMRDIAKGLTVVAVTAAAGSAGYASGRSSGYGQGYSDGRSNCPSNNSSFNSQPGSFRSPGPWDSKK